jgi:hypothetical protein
MEGVDSPNSWRTNGFKRTTTFNHRLNESKFHLCSTFVLVKSLCFVFCMCQEDRRVSNSVCLSRMERAGVTQDRGLAVDGYQRLGKP